MSSLAVSDLPPLLQPGVHEITLEALRQSAVFRFPLSKSRPAIMDGLQEIVCELVYRRIVGDVIIDGSFLTEEIEPSDADFTVCVSPQFYEGCTAYQRALLDWIGDEKTIKETHRSDCYLCVEYPRGHPLHFDGIQDRAWWVNLYSKSKVVHRQRGLGIIRLDGWLL